MRDLNRALWRKTMKAFPVLAVSSALALTGCTVDYVTDSTAPVELIIAQINGGSPLRSSLVRTEPNPPSPDFVTVEVANRAKNPNVSGIAVNNHVLLEQYEVRYFRTDGRGTEGVDVPYRISGALRINVDVADSGTQSVTIEVVRSQAKQEPPLRNIHVEAVIVLTVMAEITLRGRTLAGQAVIASGQMQIDFGNF
jgi:hypothetical protein